MLTIEYAFEEIRKMDYVIKVLESKEMNVHQKAYVEHLKSLRTAYEKELEKAKNRKPNKELEKAKNRKPNDEVDALDYIRRYIRRYFPRDGSII